MILGRFGQSTPTQKTLTEEPRRAMEVPHGPLAALEVCRVALHQLHGLGIGAEGNAGLPSVGGEGWVCAVCQE